MDRQDEIALQIFWHFAMLSMMAVGGGVLALAPDMMRYVADDNGWITRQDFIESFTLAQIAPGPNFLFATLVGMKAAGIAGAAAATIAVIVPPAAFAAFSLHWGAKRRGSTWGQKLRRAVLPLSIGMVCSTAWALTRSSVHTPLDWLAFAIAVAVLYGTRFNPLWVIGACGALGVAGIL
ncbi:MAG: chromate transporter [Magnetospirillum gryphiswaldense]|nr:chromate transporter [Magnetospirillum gryphiswaldense]